MMTLNAMDYMHNFDNSLIVAKGKIIKQRYYLETTLAEYVYFASKHIFELTSNRISNPPIQILICFCLL